MRRVRQAGELLLILLLLLCYGMALESKDLFVGIGSTTLYLPQGGNSYTALLTAEQRTASPLPFVLWRQQEQQTISATDFERSSTVSIMTVYGDSGIVLPSLRLLLAGEQTGCLLDTGSCYQLFGDLSPVGERITFAGAEYTLTGVFEHPSPMLVLQGSGSGGSECDRVTVALPDTPNKVQAAEDFAMRHGLSPYAMVSDSVWGGLALLSVQLVPLTLLCILLWQSIRLAAARRATPVLAWMIVCGTVMAAVLFWLSCGLQISIPASVLPSRWSDFEFWSDTFADLRRQTWLLLTVPKELPQAMALSAVLGCAAWSGAALALLTLVHRVQATGGKRLLRIVVWCVVASSLSVVAAQTTDASLWLMLPWFFGWRAALQAAAFVKPPA